VRLIGGPLAGAGVVLFQTSANRSGEPPASEFTALDPGVVSAADLAIDGGALAGSPSTVIDLTTFDATGDWRVLREGALSRAEVEARLATA
jgi:tRNA A37 threonylcarbamoyladenosine synthetase subunit TsaC/SUA5/YrdC